MRALVLKKLDKRRQSIIYIDLLTEQINCGNVIVESPAETTRKAGTMRATTALPARAMCDGIFFLSLINLCLRRRRAGYFDLDR